MAFDDELAVRVRAALATHTDVVERRMFGGLAFMVGGHMAVGVIGQDLMVRVGPDHYETAVAEPHVREMDFTGRPLRGMVYVERDGVRDDDELRSWVARGVAYAEAQPPK